jgi:hypothetical protein
VEKKSEVIGVRFAGALSILLLVLEVAHHIMVSTGIARNRQPIVGSLAAFQLYERTFEGASASFFFHLLHSQTTLALPSIEIFNIMAQFTLQSAKILMSNPMHWQFRRKQTMVLTTAFPKRRLTAFSAQTKHGRRKG